MTYILPIYHIQITHFIWQCILHEILKEYFKIVIFELVKACVVQWHNQFKKKNIKRRIKNKHL